MSENPVQFIIPANSQGSISCMSNAAYMQRVTVTINDDIYIFIGTGEGEPMKLDSGDGIIIISPQNTFQTASVLFEYSSSPPYTEFFQASMVKDESIVDKYPFTMINITSEDSGDNDNNDSYLSVFFLSADGPEENQRENQEEGIIKDYGSSNGQLELHAKTYYNTPEPSGFEHTILIPYPDFLPAYEPTALPFTCNNLGWDFLQGTVMAQKTALGGYLKIGVILNNCVLPEISNAQLYITASVSWWGGFPTGSKSADWEANLYYTTYKVTRVTN